MRFGGGMCVVGNEGVGFALPEAFVGSYADLSGRCPGGLSSKKSRDTVETISRYFTLLKCPRFCSV